MPSLSAFWRKEPTVLLVNFAILSTGVLALEWARSSLTSAFEYSRRAIFFLNFLANFYSRFWKVLCSTGDLLRNNPMLRRIFEVFLALTKTFLIWIRRCLVCPKMSNKIALVSLDFAGTGSMCGGNKGVGCDGRTISRSNNQDLPNRNP